MEVMFSVTDLITSGFGGSKPSGTLNCSTKVSIILIKLAICTYSRGSSFVNLISKRVLNICQRVQVTQILNLLVTDVATSRSTKRSTVIVLKIPVPYKPYHSEIQRLATLRSLTSNIIDIVSDIRAFHHY